MIDKDFYEKGYCVIDDFLDNDKSNDILKKFSDNTDWFRVDQVRKHYEKGGPFESDSKYLPDNDEIYYYNSWRAKNLESSPSVDSFLKDFFIKKIELYFSTIISCYTTYVIKYVEDDFSRLHTDDASRGDVDRVDIGLLYYVSDDWKWDWGGLLMAATDKKADSMDAIFPKHNRLP